MSRIDSNDVVLSKDGQGVYDISFDEEGDIKTNDFLDTSLLRTVYGQRRALESEVSIPERRRGWIGNEYKEHEDGSKIWLYEQSQINRTTLNGIQDELIIALNWLITFDAAISYSVSSSIDDDSNITVGVSVQRSTSKVENRYFKLFENSGEN